MRSCVFLSSATGLAVCVCLALVSPAAAAPKSKGSSSESAKKSGKEISTDDRALDKQMDWESKVLGPNTQKKIDLAKIQKLQAEEMARREKQERIDQAEKDRKEREAAAAAAAQRNTRAPSTRDVPEVQEAPPVPAKPVEKHDDAFVDKLLTGKGEKKKVTVSNDEVDQLLTKAKQEKGASISPTKGKHDTVDQLLATSDKQAAIKTKKRAEPTDEPVSAEAAAREAALKAVAAAAAEKAREDRMRNSGPAIPDAAVLRAQQSARSQPAPAPEPPASRASATRTTTWADPFAGDGGSASSKNRGRANAPARGSAAGRHVPAGRPAGNDSWQDPFESGSGAKARPAPTRTAPANRPSKRPPNWKDPFA